MANDKRMKLTVIGTIPSEHRYVDADTGLLDNENRQATEPVRVVTKPTPEPVPPDLAYLQKVLTYDPPSKVAYLSRLIGTTPEETAAMVRRGDDYVVKYYVGVEGTKRAAAWALKEKRRQESLAYWVFRGKLVKVDGWNLASREEIVTRVIHKVLSEEKAFNKLKREVDLFLKLEREASPTRETIPEDVRLFVWRRDEGRCVRCGSQERLEFDHIIPVKCGGGNTERNVQVLCEPCNRQKGASV